MNVLQKMLTGSLTAIALLSSVSVEAKVPADKLEEVEKLKKQRGGQALGPRVGKKIAAAYDMYSADQVTEALEMLLELEPKGAFDKAYVDRFIGNMYAAIEGKADIALERLINAKEADVLPFNDHSLTIKLIADLYLQERKYAEAVKYYNEFLDFSLDENPDAYLKIANAYYEMGQFKNAIEPARKAIQFFEKPNQNPYIIIMASYFEMKMNKEATKAVEDLVKNFPENPQWWVQLGSFYMMSEDYERGLSAMELAYRQGYLEKASQIKQLAQLYANNGIPYKAAVVQEKHLKEGLIEKTKQAVATLASTYRNAKEFKKAAQYYGEAAKLSDDGEYFKDQGNMLMANEEFSTAVTAFEKALEKGVEREGNVYMAIAEANYYLRNWKAADKAIKMAMKDKRTAKSAVGWVSYIKDAAERNGVSL